MKLTIYNGSPKLGKNNTEVLLQKFVEGFKSQGENEVVIHKLNKFDSMEKAADIFEKADNILIAFPLYCYSMPGGVKTFIEALEPLTGKCKGKKLGFLVQYGFIEAVHARPLERYLIKLTAMLGCEYIGTMIKGGCDSLAASPEARFKKLYRQIYNIGVTLGKNKTFDKDELDEFSKPETQKKQSKFLMKMILKLVNKYYWGGKLKKNGVGIDKSFAKPYEGQG